MKVTLLFSLLCCILFSENIYGQRFQFVGVIGGNASQIDGDSLYGYKKIGWHFGGRISYLHSNTFDVELEMLFSQRGSSKQLFKRQANELIQANFVEFPIILSIRDWYMDKDNYHKIRAEFGLSYARLVRAQSIKLLEENFNKNDISWLFGAGFRATRKVGFSARYTSSLVNMYQDPSHLVNRYKSYFLTFRSEYYF